MNRLHLFSVSMLLILLVGCSKTETPYLQQEEEQTEIQQANYDTRTVR